MSLSVFSHINQASNNLEDYNLDAWDGYQANRNRTFETLYENNINNTIMIAGDSHANWVSDVVWLDHGEYDSKTGLGAIGVEFAGTAVTSPGPLGANGKIPASVKKSKALVDNNSVLQWSEMYYRGYFELHITPKDVQAKFYGTPKIRQRDFSEVSLANFTVKDGANRLDRGKLGVTGGGVVENGWVKGGKTERTDIAKNTETGEWIKIQ